MGLVGGAIKKAVVTQCGMTPPPSKHMSRRGSSRANAFRDRSRLECRAAAQRAARDRGFDLRGRNRWWELKTNGLADPP